MSNGIIKGPHHVAVICSNYEVSKKFYVEVLQTRIVSEIYREERNSWKLNVAFADGVEIELFSFPGSPKRPSYPEALGLRHLAVVVSNLDAAVEHLGLHGIPHEPVRVDELTGARFVFFADPDGLPIELYELN